MPNQKQSLLLTKLNRPRIPHDLVERTRLMQQLNSSIEYPLTLVCAPAGYGKTTLICTWLDRVAAGLEEAAPSLPAAWSSLDETESDLDQFISYVIAAIRTIFPGACEESWRLLQARQSPPWAVSYTTLSNELAQLPGELILVLDDYQFISGKAVHGLLVELARHWPKPLHMVLISRIDPPLPITRLRAKGLVHEIRTQDLRFTPQETAAYLSQTQLAHLSQPTLLLLEERFEGWPAGLHLAALSLRSANSQESILSVLANTNTSITGYLMDEVLSQQFPAIYSFLLKSSILNRFCASLCTAVIGESDTAWNVRACLDWIERAELFLISLDNHREWYRYHHLFQELLRQRLLAEMEPDQVSDLHRRASTWFEERGLLDEALHHALEAGNLELAARQMSAGLRDALNREDRLTLERWLRLLPETMMQQHPGLLMIRAWAQQFMWRLDLQAQTLQQVETLLDSGAGAALPAADIQILHAQILLLKAQQAYLGNQPTLVIQLCRQALALLPPSWAFGRGAAMLFLGLSMQASGQAAEVERLLLDEYERHSHKTDLYALFVLESLCYVYWQSGQLEQTRQLAQLLAQGAASSGNMFIKGMADWFLGKVCYQQNELEEAARHFISIFDKPYVVQISVYRDAVAGLALIYQSQGESAEAWQMVESISRFDLEQTGAEDNRTRSLRARVQLRQGNLEGASNWVDAITDPPPDSPFLLLEEPRLTRVHILVARGTDADLRLALQILDALNEIADRTHNVPHKIEILLLRALALVARGESSTAATELKQGLALARPGGFIRVFVDLGKPMQAMLRRLVGQGYPAETVQRILFAFPTDDGEEPAGTPRPSPDAPGLAEPLTRREIEVLTLLRGPLSIKEIALTLNLSYGTVRRHTINIYGKLGVNGRMSAVVRAEELNILPPR